MKAIRVQAPGGPEAMRLETCPPPEPATGEARVRIEAAGVNFIDVYQRTGLYPVPFPNTPGQEAAGVVEAVGPAVSGVKVGDRVAYWGVLGAYAELATVSVEHLITLPAGLTARQGAAAMVQGMTAHYLAHSTYPLARGDACLVHAAAGGVGLLLCQIAKLRGATVIGTVSTEAKAQLAKGAGADHVVLYTRDDFETEVSRITGGHGVQVVYDSVGRTTFDKSLRCLAPRGTMALFGQSSGPVLPFDAQILNRQGSLFLTRPSLGHYVATREELDARAQDVFGWIENGTLKLSIGAEFELAEAAEAHRQLEGRKTTGKVLLIPGR